MTFGFDGNYTTDNEATNFSNIEQFQIFGTIQDDLTVTGDGNDGFAGGAGDNLLVGGNGADNFRYFSPNEGTDLITDYFVADDSFLISSSGFGLSLVCR